MMTITKRGYLAAYGNTRNYQFTKEFDRKITVCFDTIEYDIKSDINILVQCEPPTLYRDFYKMVVNNKDHFDLILTYDPRLLQLENSRLFVPVDTWINDKQPPSIKNKSVSFITSSKIYTNDQRMRMMILRRLENKQSINDLTVMQYRSPPRIPNRDDYYRLPLFNIACENQVMDNMFTEKLLDCFLCKTVPIYYGCTNIDKFFDVGGIIRFTDIDRFQHVLNMLSTDLYYMMQESIENNYKLALEFCQNNIYQRIESIVEEML